MFLWVRDSKWNTWMIRYLHPQKTLKSNTDLCVVWRLGGSLPSSVSSSVPSLLGGVSGSLLRFVVCEQITVSPRTPFEHKTIYVWACMCVCVCVCIYGPAADLHKHTVMVFIFLMFMLRGLTPVCSDAPERDHHVHNLRSIRRKSNATRDTE